MKKRVGIIVVCCILLTLFACGQSTESAGDTVIPDKYLPIGSVVLLKGGNQPLMIYAREVYFETGETRDYMSVLYPFGYVDDEGVYSFDHSEIEKVLFVGYVDENEEKVNEYLLERENQTDAD